MRFANLKLAQKLGIGFGLLLFITVILGIIALFNFGRISRQTHFLSKEYLPAMTLASELQSNYLNAALELRGYSFTLNSEYLTKGQGYLDQLSQKMQESEELVNNADKLGDLVETNKTLNQGIDKYRELLNNTISINNQIIEARSNMDKAAASAVESCQSYLQNQNSLFMRESSGSGFKTRFQKITLINAILTKINNIRVHNFKDQANRDYSKYQQTIDQFNISDELVNIRKLTHLQDDIEALDIIEREAGNYKQSMQNFLTLQNQVMDIEKERITYAYSIIDNSKAMAANNMEKTDDITNNTVQMVRASTAMLIGGIIIALILGIILAIIITQSITSGLISSIKIAEEVADGNLNIQMNNQLTNRSDEIGKLANALSNMVTKLREIVESILNGADSIASASQQMASTSQQMSQSVNEQASSIEEVSSSMEEMVSNIQQNAENSQQTEKIATNAVKEINEGSIATNTAVDAMKNIAEKIKIINDIAFQTNILALNAAVEAARAGEHGKGFAVVASEVRKLAERSKIAADEIDSLSKNGVSVAERAGEKLRAIVPEIEKTANLVQEISAASIEQNNGADQVNNAIQQVNEITQQNAASSEEIASSSEELSSQAETLRDIIQFFRLEASYKLKNQFKQQTASTSKKTAKVKSNDNAVNLKMFKENFNGDDFHNY